LVVQPRAGFVVNSGTTTDRDRATGVSSQKLEILRWWHWQAPMIAVQVGSAGWHMEWEHGTRPSVLWRGHTCAGRPTMSSLLTAFVYYLTWATGRPSARVTGKRLFPFRGLIYLLGGFRNSAARCPCNTGQRVHLAASLT
jgi:hypothetical protein